VHLLIPQLENIVRVHLKRAGVQTWTRSADGVVMENGLGSLVKYERMEQVFGAALTFEINALFCDQLGPNLRNELAHGLLGAPACHSAPAVYGWWLMLRLVASPRWRLRSPDSPSGPTH
jgi:hypothetical protein